MLESIRRGISSFVIKVLFLVLVLSFVVWGIADVFQPGQSSQWAAKVGDATISARTFEDEYQTTLRRLQSMFGSALTAEEARAQGIPASVLQQMVNRTLLDQGVADARLAVTDAMVREAITGDPRFRNEAGQFEPEIFRQAIRAGGFSESQYVALLRDDMARAHMLDSLIGAVAVPRPASEWLARYAGERRTATFVRVIKDQVPASPPPDDETLRRFHRDKALLFTAPELRSVQAIVLGAGDLSKTITIPEADVRRAYDERLAEFTQPERRSFQQMLFDGKAEAEQALTRLRQGADFVALAQELLKVAPGDVALSDVTRSQLPAELAAVVFSLQPETLSDPVETALGWHLIRVTAVQPERQQAFAEAAPQISRELATERAVEQLIEIGSRIEDELGRGASVSEAAAQLDLPLRTIPAIDQEGRDDAGTEVPDLPEGFVETAFATDAGTESPLVEGRNDVYYVLRVETVTPAALRPFEAVSEAVRTEWQAQARTEAARKEAEGLAERVGSGGELARVAADAKRTAETTPALTRTGGQAEAALPPGFLEALFANRRGATFLVEADDAVILGQVTSIAEPAAADAEPGKDALTRQLRQDLSEDLSQQFLTVLRRRHPVTINDRTLDKI